MKLLKLIEILRDRDNWTYDSNWNSRYFHKPTGIYLFTGIICWNKEGKEIYSSLFGSTFVLPYFVNKMKKHLEKKDKDSLDNIYDRWKAQVQ